MNLRTYLEYIIDGHFCAFNNDMVIPSPKPCVGMMDFQFTQQHDVLEAYDKFIPQLRNVLWLNACGLTFDDIKTVHEKYKSIIGGFGELKLYDDYMIDGKKVNVGKKDIGLAYDVCAYSLENGSLPVYIHYDIDSEQAAEAFSKCFRIYESVPVVISHCGMSGEENENNFAFEFCKEYKDAKNLWFDLSWHASNYFANNPELILELPQNRIIWGSDITPNYLQRVSGGEPVQMDPWELYEKIRPYLVQSNTNIKRLYQNSPNFVF